MKNFIILTNGRSGSNYLVDTINQHPNLCNYGEILGPWSHKRKLKKFLRIKTETQYVQFILKSRVFFHLSSLFYILKDSSSHTFKPLSSIVQVGIKDFGINIERYNLSHWLISDPDLKVVHLYRENQLDRYLSLVAMHDSGLVSAKSVGSVKKIHVDCEHLLANLEIYESEFEFETKLVSSMGDDRLMSISYDELFYGSRKKEIYDNLFAFLEVKPIPILDRHVKILPKTLSEKVANFEEMRNILKGSKFEKYLA